MWLKENLWVQYKLIDWHVPSSTKSQRDKRYKQKNCNEGGADIDKHFGVKNGTFSFIYHPLAVLSQAEISHNRNFIWKFLPSFKRKLRHSYRFKKRWNCCFNQINVLPPSIVTLFRVIFRTLLKCTFLHFCIFWTTLNYLSFIFRQFCLLQIKNSLNKKKRKIFFWI